MALRSRNLITGKLPDDASRVSHDYTIWFHILGNDRAGTDHCMFADDDARQNRRVCTDAGAAAYRDPRKTVWIDLRAGHPVVGECRVRPDENVVLDARPIPEVDPG